MTGPIIAATDFSSRADRAVDRALALGRQLGTAVTLVHARELIVGKEFDQAVLDAKMQAILPETDVPVSFAYPEGRAPNAIATYADDHDASMLVIGVARYNSIGDFFSGTAVDEAVRSCSKPVLVVKNRPKGPYTRIIVATDFSFDSLQALSWVAATFPEAEIHLVHAFHVPYEAWNKAPYVAEEIKAAAEARFAEVAGSLNASVRDRVNFHAVKANVSAAVNQIVDEEAAQLVVAGSHGESGFRHATIGSQANHLLTTSKVDTMIISPRLRD